MRDLFQALRPYQWSKNLLVFAGLVFSLDLLQPGKVVAAAVAFVAFCAASSAVYLVNDVIDRERDRYHPTKRLRPIASGRIGIGPALTVAVLLATAALGAATWVNLEVALVIAGYFALQGAYVAGLKDVPIVDVLCVATGFVLRAVAGAVAVAEPISQWLLICTIFLALFISLAKRRHEVATLAEAGSRHRVALGGYSVELLDQLLSVATAGTLISYALYTTDPVTIAKFDTELLPLTLPVVIYGLFRFQTLVQDGRLVGDPSRLLLRDRATAVAVTVWGAMILAILYLH